MNTKTNNRNYFGGGLPLLLILGVLVIWWSLGNGNQTTSITNAEFVTALQEGKIDKVQISQNTEVPTGNVTVLYKDKTQKSMYVSDVNEIQEIMETNGFTNYKCTNVPQKSW